VTPVPPPPAAKPNLILKRRRKNVWKNDEEKMENYYTPTYSIILLYVYSYRIRIKFCRLRPFVDFR
jgi:hypothetical protein